MKDIVKDVAIGVGSFVGGLATGYITRPAVAEIIEEPAWAKEIINNSSLTAERAGTRDTIFRYLGTGAEFTAIIGYVHNLSPKNNEIVRKVFYHVPIAGKVGEEEFAGETAAYLELYYGTYTQRYAAMLMSRLPISGYIVSEPISQDAGTLRFYALR